MALGPSTIQLASRLLKSCGVGVKRLEDLIAFQLATAFKREVYRIVRSSSKATRDLRYRDQLFDAASSIEANMAEGWRRYHAREFTQFLRYALGSLEETRGRLRDGVDRGHFPESDCAAALELANRCAGATTNLLKSLRPLMRSSRGSP